MEQHKLASRVLILDKAVKALMDERDEMMAQFTAEDKAFYHEVIVEKNLSAIALAKAERKGR